MQQNIATVNEVKPIKVRDHAQDIAKGLSILLVMQIHIVNAPQWFQIVEAIICCWLMPFFFTISGYYYKPGKKSIKENIIHRTKQLMIPYLQYSIGVWVITTIYNLIQHTYTLVECLYHYLTFLVSRNFLVLIGVEPIELVWKTKPHAIDFNTVVIPFWFVIMMMFSNIIFYLIVDYTMANNKRFISVTAGLVFVTYLLNLGTEAMKFGLPWNIQNVPMGTALMLFGAMFGKYNLLSKETVSAKWRYINSLACLLIVIIVQVKYPGAGSWSAGKFSFFGPIETFPCVLFGIMSPFMLVNFSRLLEKIPGLGKALSWIGARTLPFLFIHLMLSSLLGEITGIKRKSTGTLWESLLNLAITIAIIVIYRIVWELILRAIKTKKVKAQNA